MTISLEHGEKETVLLEAKKIMEQFIAAVQKKGDLSQSKN